MFEAQHAVLVGAWGLILSAVGLLVSLGGFWVTIAQLRRTKRATEAVEGEVRLLKNRMATFDYASECVRAAKSLEHAIQLLRSKNWEDAAIRLLEGQGILNRIAMSQEGSSESRDLARDTSEQLLIAVRELEDAFDKAIDFDPRDLTFSLRKQINSLDRETMLIFREL
jgi:hypothetical protein